MTFLMHFSVFPPFKNSFVLQVALGASERKLCSGAVEALPLGPQGVGEVRGDQGPINDITLKGEDNTAERVLPRAVIDMGLLFRATLVAEVTFVRSVVTTSGGESRLCLPF